MIGFRFINLLVPGDPDHFAVIRLAVISVTSELFQTPLRVPCGLRIANGHEEHSESSEGIVE